MPEDLSRETRLSLLERMLRMRRFEEMVVHVADAHSYIGRNHLYIGHEGTGAAVMALLKPGDLSHSTHRNHGHIVGRGADAGKALAEIMGREGGLCGGRGGTWHMTDKSVGFQSTSAMVGGSIGLATGGGFACRQLKKGNVSVALFGDGVLDEGISYEAFNFASKFSLPMLFMCENNEKPGRRETSQLAADRLLDIPKALKIHTMTVDGGDVEAVHATVSEALARIRKDQVPVFVESQIEAWPGSHQVKLALLTGVTDLSMAWNDGKIAGEHADWIRQEPVLSFVRKLLAGKAATQDEILAIDKRVTAEIEKARAYAEASPFPKAESAVLGAFA
ncbi:MAG TPA: thiamine pyrophosphate-dependent enzyme [Alphaproteobacteria bacterium]|jgi:TPP-dependent pyruvate/acetoin dehydrogenase alpha subunit